MSNRTATEMSDDEIATFLDSQRTGVLSLAAGDDAYGIPVSFTHDADDEALYIRLGYTRESEKREYLDAVDRVTFVVYDDTDEGWKSVLARGALTELSESSLDSQVVQYVHDLQIPYFRVFDRPGKKIEFEIARIDPTELTGIVEAPSRD